jgi:hypothetical protein
MFSLRRSLAEGRSRIRALWDLFNVGLDESECEARALKLLKDWLSPKQLAQFDACGYFDVVGSDTGKKYRIHYGSSMNIDELDEHGRPCLCHCFVTDITLAKGDVVLAQKIALETGELAALSVANRFGPRRRSRSLGMLH